MYVTRVSLSNLFSDEAMGRVTGSVSMDIGNDAEAESQAVNAQFLCRISAGATMPQSDRLIALARDALRQARRFPDYMGLCENDAFLICLYALLPLGRVNDL